MAATPSDAFLTASLINPTNALILSTPAWTAPAPSAEVLYAPSIAEIQLSTWSLIATASVPEPNSEFATVAMSFCAVATAGHTAGPGGPRAMAWLATGAFTSVATLT